MGGLLQLLQLMAQLITLLRHGEDIDQHAMAFHAVEHLGQGQFQLMVELGQRRFGGQLPTQGLMHL